MELYMQAANSLDVNLLDLGFFPVIQSFNDAPLKNEEELIHLVSAAYDNYPQVKLNCTWLRLQSVFNHVILNHGDNDYNIEHLLKEKLEQMGQLPDVLDVVEEVMTFDLFNTPTGKPNDEMDNGDMETSLLAEEVEENANMNEINAQSGDENMETHT